MKLCVHCPINVQDFNFNAFFEDLLCSPVIIQMLYYVI